MAEKESVYENDFDISAARLRADGGDLRAWIAALARKLTEALPERSHVEFGGLGLLGRKHRQVRGVRVELGDTRYELRLDGERVKGYRQREVGGISIKREPLDVKTWIAELTEQLREEAERSDDARIALERLLS